MNFPVTKRAWQRLKLTLAEYLVSTLIESDPRYRVPPVNICLASAVDEIRHCRELYFPSLSEKADDGSGDPKTNRAP